MDLDGVFEDGEQEVMRELQVSSVEDVTMRTRLLENEIRVLRDESNRLALDLQSDKERVKENVEKIKMNKQLPYLVGNVVEILDLKPEVRGGRRKCLVMCHVARSAESGTPDLSSDPEIGPVRTDALPDLNALPNHPFHTLHTLHNNRTRTRTRTGEMWIWTRGARAKPWC
jgi:hypothetical protein|tara:strand:- start:1729 stop:2241 length:513 start_codon:yes stop_codon:yes gene_type:complete